jgi:hypothetical protein
VQLFLLIPTSLWSQYLLLCQTYYILKSFKCCNFNVLSQPFNFLTNSVKLVTHVLTFKCFFGGGFSIPMHEKNKPFLTHGILLERSHFWTSGDYKFTSSPYLVFMHGTEQLTKFFWVATNVSKNINAQLRWLYNKTTEFKAIVFLRKRVSLTFTWSRERLHVFLITFLHDRNFSIMNHRYMTLDQNLFLQLMLIRYTVHVYRKL